MKDWQRRFICEFYWLDDKIKKLEKTLNGWADLKFTPQCPKSLLEEQAEVMRQYRDILYERAQIEHITIM